MTCRIAHIVKCTDKFWDSVSSELLGKQNSCVQEKKLSAAVEIFWYDSCILWFFFRTSYVCTAHNTVHCIGIGKTSSSVLHGQRHPQDFPPEHSHYLPTGGNQSCFPQNWKIRETPVSLTISRLFWNGNASWTVAGKVHFLEGIQICNQLRRSQTILRLFRTNSD